MRAVLDPNVLISAPISPAGPSAQVVLTWGAGRFELTASPRLINELTDVLARPKFRRWIDVADADEFVASLRHGAVIVRDPPPGQTALTRDPDDDHLVVLARAVKADFVVSGDNHLTGLADPDPPILTPRQFLDRLTP